MRHTFVPLHVPRVFRHLMMTAGVLLACLASSPAGADNWQASVYDMGLPARVVAVDKARQLFHLYEKKSPLALKYMYPCTTGQVDGDKQIINDMRTPEGVYFVEYKIANGLDFKEYGGIAYTLNYPNPVDRLRGKTGHGIWIHSKGFGIVPRDTRGCIAIGLQEIDEVGPMLLPGTPVVVAEHVPTDSIPALDNGTARHLRTRMEQWTRSWAARSSKLFDFYDAEAYTKAMPESFTAFRANKERLFKLFAWINIFNREVHVMEGPGYWVTWAEQFYRAPNLSTEGIRRLYWQRGKDNQFRIVGMEWLPRNLGMQAAFQKGQLVAAVEAPVTDAVSEAPVPPPLNMPETPGAAPQVPTPARAPTVAASTQPALSAVAAAPEALVPDAPVAAAPVATAPAAAAPAATAPAALVLDARMEKRLQERMEAWCAAWQQRTPDFFSFYDQRLYGTLKDIPFRDNFAALKADMTRRFRAPWIEVFQRGVSVRAQGPYAVTSAEQWLREPGRPPVQGVRTLYWQQQPDGDFRIVASQWEPGERGMQADYLEAVAAPVSRVIEDWRTAWQAGDVERYMSFYAPDARQQGRGVAGIREHKARLWAKAAPAEVVLSGVRLQVDPAGVRVDMTQAYRDNTGRGDRGTKMLLLQPHANGWRIVQEDWAPEGTLERTP